MNKVRKWATLFILVFIIQYYCWIIFGKGNDDLISILGDFFKFFANFISFCWLFNAYIHTTNKNRNFWLFLSLGSLLHIFGRGIWIYYELFLQVNPPFPSIADGFWLFAYVFYLIAFLFRLYILKHSFSFLYFFIDMGTVIIVAISLNWNFIVQPMLLMNSDMHNIYIGYPLGGITLLFGVLSLYLISQEAIPQKALLILIVGFLIKFIANSAYAFQVVHESYVWGSYIDPLWPLSILLIGLAGLYARVPTNDLPKTHIIFQKSRQYLPYLAVSVLLYFAIQKHYQIMEALTFGLATTIVLLLIRIILSIVRNEKLLLKQERLSEDLIEKNLQLQQMNATVSDKEQQLKDIFDNLEAVIWSRDLRTNATMLSTSVVKIIGYSSRDLLANPMLWRESIHPEDAVNIDIIDPSKFIINKTNPIVEFRVIHPNKSIKWVQALRTPIFDEMGNLIKVHAVITDITEQKRTEEKIQSMAYYDELTGLPNRIMFYERLKQEMELAKLHHHKVAIMFIDLDRFKLVNDTFGHHFGDLLLQAVSKRLKECVKEKGTVCRIGGDEFTIVLPSNDINESEWIAEEIIALLNKPFSIEAQELFITPSIGISLFPSHGESEEDLIKKADIAMYYAKERGKNNYYVYSVGLDMINSRKMEIENALRRAIEYNEFSLFYQPKVEISSGKILGMEALIRWKHPRMGHVPPLEFIPLAEETGLILPIGIWVLKIACFQNMNWQRMGLPSLPISVNVSARQLNEDFVATVSQVLQETKLDPKYLELEITESVMQNINESSLILNKLNQLGIQLSLDDFGTGYSSLSYLNNLPVSSVKIDKSFINDIMDHSNGGVMVKTIIDMGRNLHFNVIAEGIENEQQKLFLLQNNCFIGQGFLFSPPVPADEMVALLKAQKER